MSVLKTVGWLRGYIVIRADGYFTERFLNICMRRGIFLHSVRHTGENSICACISIDGFMEIRSVAAKTRTKITIVKRCGLPFWLHRYRKRRSAAAGVVIFFVLLWYFSSHVTGIDVRGNERLSGAVVTDELKNIGVYPGVAIRKLDRRLIQNQMMTRLDDIAWIGVNIKGSRVYIEIKERLDTKVEVTKDMPCNIIAARDGVIRLMEVRDGQSMVSAGDMVEKGDLLVSGAVDSTKEGIRYVHSFGEIYADTLYKRSGEYTLEYTEKIYTGAEKKRYTVEIMGKRIPLFISKRQPYENCDRSAEKKEYRSPVSFLPSVFAECEKYTEYNPQKKSRTVDETAALAKEELCKALNSEIPQGAEIKNINFSHAENKPGVLTATVEYECRENIALQRPIDKIEFLNYDIEGNVNKNTDGKISR